MSNTFSQVEFQQAVQQEAGGGASGGGFADFMEKNAQYFVIPMSLIVVFIYQVYFKKKGSKPAGQSAGGGRDQPQARGRGGRLSEQFQQQQSQMEGRFAQQQNQQKRNIGNIENEMKGMQEQMAQM